MIGQMFIPAAQTQRRAFRFQGIIHDFVMLNVLADTAAARGAITLANAWLRE
jgi:acetyl esterase